MMPPPKPALSRPVLTGDPQPAPHALQQNLAALQDTLLRIGHQNRDAGLQPLIADGLSRCAMLRQQLDRMNAGQSGPEPIVDAQTFQRLMALAGPATTRELLDQLLLDLGDARDTLAAAAPVQDWASVRGKCHVLIAVAGAIGAHAVQANAEQLHKAATDADGPLAASLTAGLHRRLNGLISFVQDERLSRGT